MLQAFSKYKYNNNKKKGKGKVFYGANVSHLTYRVAIYLPYSIERRAHNKHLNMLKYYTRTTLCAMYGTIWYFFFRFAFFF